MPKTMNVRVSTVDAELEFAIQSSTTGKQLFDQVVRTIGLRETWYFGLQYVDSTGLSGWLALKKKVQSQDVKKETPLQFKLRAKYFPEDVSEELIQDITRHMFYLQVRESVLSEMYYCPPETAVLLASYAIQAKFGDYSTLNHKHGFLEKERILPPKVISQHSLTTQQWEDRIVTWYSEHKGMSRDDATLEYLKIVQDLEMYGINYFDISNKKGSPLLLGIDALGVNIYGKEDRLTPKIGFPWSDIGRVSFAKKKFVIKPVDKDAPDFIFYVSKERINKGILDLCLGNHELYMRRRKPDSIEVQQMKAHARDEKAAKEAERLALHKEKQAREDAERQQKELQDRIMRFEGDMERAQKDLESSKEAALLLEHRVREAERERLELEVAQRQAEEARRLAEEAVNQEKAEREIKEREAAEALVLLELKLKEAHEREEEASRLQAELEAARMEMEVKQKTLDEVRSAPPKHIAVERQEKYHEQNWKQHERNDKHHEKEDDKEPMPTIVIENGSDDSDDDSSDKNSHDLLYENDVELNSSDDRVAHVDKDERINHQLKSLSADLASSKVEAEVTRNDLIYRKNKSEGRDKYKTLKQIRAGNTKSRIEVFESM